MQERQEFEQELNQQRESSSMMKDQLRKEHEEEISALMDENSKLEEELQEAKRKVHGWNTHTHTHTHTHLKHSMHTPQS